jgi:hypothetical protein
VCLGRETLYHNSRIKKNENTAVMLRQLAHKKQKAGHNHNHNHHKSVPQHPFQQGGEEGEEEEETMFRRFADRVASAVASVASPLSPSPSPSSSSPSSSLQQLTNMGFSEADGRHALQISGNNVEQATDWLLTNRTMTTTTAASTSPAMQATAQMVEDDDLQKALAASLEDANNNNNTNNTNTNTVRSAASERAGQAALARFDQKNTTNNRNRNKKNKKKTATTANASTNASTATFNNYNNNNHNNNYNYNNNKPTPVPISISAAHPNVKVPKQLSHHDKEEQILRCANRMAPHPKAVDTVLKSLKQLRQNPNHSKFQSIDTDSAAFSKTLNVPGAVDFFKAMNYHESPSSNFKVLQLAFCDPATIYLGISALEQVQQTSDVYARNKAQLAFDVELQQLLNQQNQNQQQQQQQQQQQPEQHSTSTTTTTSEEELAQRREEFLRQCPSEPTNGGSLIVVHLGSSTKISRKFDADDTLQDVLYWIASGTTTGGGGITIYDKLLGHEWYLVNRNHQNRAYNMKTGPPKTLQALGCWPSGRLAVVPTLPEHAIANTSSRGLGAAGIASDYL